MTNSPFNKDFQDFQNTSKYPVDDPLRAKVLNSIKSDLHPHSIQVFIKLLSLQSFIGALTLFLCPQFNSSFTNNFDFFHYLHHTFGEVLCMAACGSLFIGSGAIFASYFLCLEEIQLIRKSKVLYYFSISSLAIMLFLLLGADIYLNLAFYWIIGASLSGALLFEVNRLIRYKWLTSSH